MKPPLPSLASRPFAWAVLPLLGFLLPAVVAQGQMGMTTEIASLTITNTFRIAGTNNVLLITNGVALVSTNSSSGGLGYTQTAGQLVLSNSAMIFGSGSVWSNVGNGTFYMGRQGVATRLVITNGGQMVTLGNNTLGYAAAGQTASDNEALITGSGSVWTSGAVSLGNLSSSNRLIVTKGGTLNLTGSPSTPTIGTGGSDNEVRVSDGGIITIPTGGFILGNSNGLVHGSNNRLIVSDPGSYVTNGSNLNIGYTGEGNGVIVSNGGQMVAGNTYVGRFVTSTNAFIHVTGADSLLSVANLYVGSNASSRGVNSRVLVEEGGTLEITSATTSMLGDLNGNGTLSNRSGILQFTMYNPTITPGTAGSFVMTNGIVSYRRIATADITSMRITTNIVMQGDSGFRLLDATNATGLASYTFDSVANTGVSTNFQRLVLMGAAPQWRSGRLNVGTGGELLVTNAANATVGATFTNLGSVRVVNSSVTWQSNVVFSGGSFTLRDSTNAFERGAAVGASGFFGGSGRVVNGADFTNAGTVSPGNSPGTLEFSSNLTLLGSSVLVLEIAGTNAGAFDRLLVEGTLAKGGTVLVTNLGYTFLGGESFDFVDAAALAGSFSSLDLPVLTGGMTWNTSLFEGQGILSVIAIPEPTVFAILGLGALLALARRRKA